MARNVGSGMGAFQELMEDPSKKYCESKNFLTALVRKMMVQLGLNTRTYSIQIERWLRRKYGFQPGSNNEVSTAKNNFHKEITHDAISANVFQKFTDSVGATRITISMKLEFPHGREPEYTEIQYDGSAAKDPEGFNRYINENPDK